LQTRAIGPHITATGSIRAGFLLNSGSGITEIEVALPDDLLLPAVLALLAALPSNFAQTEQLS